ncbi:unnamed protein product [Caenorhabditis auriculariae]|uniref:Uncharacterized protein n=1 Tax=Caenorhabditis auriculariae TaxID=2777116 RepID=A0A8S1H431_9PELO|nr:unnamed protein product [Caenorhabditis auriculariae]
MSAREAQRLMDAMEKAIEAAQNSMEEEERLNHYLALATEKARTDDSLRRKLEVLRIGKELAKTMNKAAADIEAADQAQNALDRYLEEAGDDMIDDLSEESDQSEEPEEEPNNSDDDVGAH